MGFLHVSLTALMVSHFSLEHLKPTSCLLAMINWEDVELRLLMSPPEGRAGDKAI